MFQFPVMYMVGQRPNFQFSDAARKHIREYLDHGGMLVVDNAWARKISIAPSGPR